MAAKRKKEVARIKVAIADDHTLFRKGMVKLIEDFENMRVLYEAEDGKELLARMEEQLPDVVLMDLRMPVMDGMEATAIITEEYPEVRVIALTQYKEEKLIAHTIKQGACAYLLKTAKPEEVEFVIHKVLEKGYHFSEEVAKAVVDRDGKRPRKNPGFDRSEDLNNREREILRLLPKGLTTDEIADKINLSSSAVEKHRRSILQKLNCRNTAELISWAAKNGLID